MITIVKNKFISVLRILFLEEFFFRLNLIRPLTKELRNIDTILELGAGKTSYLRKIKNKAFHITAIDIHESSLNIAKSHNVYNEYILGDIKELDGLVQENSFDAVVAFDVIEHLTKEVGNRLIKGMIKAARQKVVIFTPNGFLEQPAFDNNPFQEHISGWSFEEFHESGFRIVGVNGYKCLRGMYSKPIVKPIILGNFIANISLIFLRLLKQDKKAFALLCFKDTEK